jgi:hypothetical protein
MQNLLMERRLVEALEQCNTSLRRNLEGLKELDGLQ